MGVHEEVLFELLLLALGVTRFNCRDVWNDPATIPYLLKHISVLPWVQLELIFRILPLTAHWLLMVQRRELPIQHKVFVFNIDVDLNQDKHVRQQEVILWLVWILVSHNVVDELDLPV